MIDNTSAAGAPTNIINSEQAALTFFGPASVSQTSQEFTVDQFPFSFAAFNLASDDVITVQQIVSHGGTKLVSTYQPVSGPAVLNANTSKLIIEHPGRYQLHHTGSSSLGTFTVIGGAYSSTSNGFAQLAAALQAAIGGVNVTGTTPVQVTGSGTQGDPFIVSTPDIVVDHAGNLRVLVGSGAGVTNSGVGDVAIGYQAGNPITNGGNGNISIGRNTSIQGGQISNRNVVIGFLCGPQVMTGHDGNVVIGEAAATSTPNVGNAVVIGGNAGNSATNALDMTAVGYRAGNISTKSGTYIGSFSGQGNTFQNTIIINNPSGAALVGTQANQALLGDSSITQLVTAGSIIQGGVISASDERLKNNIEPEYESLEKLSQLNPVTFKWNLDAIKEFNAVVDTTEQETLQHGLIAQEVEKIFPTFVKEIDRGGGAYKVIRYEKLITVLLAALQELDQKVNMLEGKLNG